ncbi:hypothetical protein F4821DRAFT_238500 [Hypoxylon rubiginosum]|uniref:Uncharacterized protein n=1 Tax=Hypoxylon rubiginosum TaxID=110542 RepID=A0ACC0D0N8_9PEZI|nr:hypothetical protein F4821DRAFT_238500 [Hypoxylon rubiginosum]
MALALNCRCCGLPGSLFTAVSWNPNGNADRPYYKCVPCNQFIAFIDTRGNDPANPHCDCERPSKRQISGKDSKTPRKVFYVCTMGQCDFYNEERDEDDNIVTIPREDVGSLIRLRFI